MGTPIDDLKLFCQLAQDLRECKLLSSGWQLEMNIKWSAETQALRIDANWPDEDLLRSFLLTFRQFVMQGSRASIHHVYDLVERHAPDDATRQQAREGRAAWKVARTEGPVVVIRDDSRYTPEQVLDLWINGRYFHSDEAKRKKLEELTGPATPVNRFQFLNLMLDGTGQVFFLEGIVKRMLDAGVTSA